MTSVPAGTPPILDPEVYPDAVLVAASLAEVGWSVLPLRHGTKQPLTSGGSGHAGTRLRSAQDVIATAEQYGELDEFGTVGRWPGFGVLTGEPGAGGWCLVVIDVDGPQAEEALDEMLAEVGPSGRAWARSTYVVGTARGRHLYGVTRRKAPPTSSGALAEHLDVRGASNGSYVVVAGSLHKSGKRYRDVTDHARNGPAATVQAPDAPGVFARIEVDPEPSVVWSRPLPMPDELVAALTPADSPRLRVVETAPEDDREPPTWVSSPAALAEERLGKALRTIGAATAGTRHRVTHDAPHHLARVRAGLLAADATAEELGPLADEDDVLRRLLDAALADRPDGSPGMGEDQEHRRDARRAIDDGWRTGTAKPDRFALPGRPRSTGSPTPPRELRADPAPAPTPDAGDDETPEVLILDPSPWGAGHRLDEPPPQPPSRPELGRRSDGVPMLAPRTTSIVHARKKAGKTFLALAWTADVARSGRRVLWIDWEDGVADLHERLVAMGLDDEARRHVTVLRPGSARLGAVGDRYGPGTPNAHDAALDELLATERPALVVVNSLGRLLGRHGLNPNAADDTERVEPLLTETLIATGAAVVVIDHQGNATTDRSAGSHRKGALVTGAELSVERVQRMGRGLRGWATIRLVDERNGHLAHLTRGDDALARLLVDATAPDGSLTVSLDPPEGTPAASLDEDGLTLDADAVLGDDDARAVLRGLAAHPDGLTTTRLRQEVGVANGGEPLRRHTRTVAALVAAGSVLVSPGARGSKVHRLAPDVEVPAEPGRDAEDGEVRS